MRVSNKSTAREKRVASDNTNAHASGEHRPADPGIYPWEKDPGWSWPAEGCGEIVRCMEHHFPKIKGRVKWAEVFASLRRITENWKARSPGEAQEFTAANLLDRTERDDRKRLLPIAQALEKLEAEAPDLARAVCMLFGNVPERQLWFKPCSEFGKEPASENACWACRESCWRNLVLAFRTAATRSRPDGRPVDLARYEIIEALRLVFKRFIPLPLTSARKGPFWWFCVSCMAVLLPGVKVTTSGWTEAEQIRRAGKHAKDLPVHWRWHKPARRR